jgi:hypothetical protein
MDEVMDKWLDLGKESRQQKTFKWGMKFRCDRVVVIHPLKTNKS